MIASGEKKEEYRELKQYWKNRLCVYPWIEASIFKKFDYIIFTNGYSKNAPKIKVECKDINTGLPIAKWSDNAQGTHIIISLGKVVTL